MASQAITQTIKGPGGSRGALQCDNAGALLTSQNGPLDATGYRWTVNFDSSSTAPAIAGAGSYNIQTYPRTLGVAAGQLPVGSRVRLRQTQAQLAPAYGFVRGRKNDGTVYTWQGEFLDGYLEDEENFVSRTTTTTTFDSPDAWQLGPSCLISIDEVLIRPYGETTNGNAIDVDVQILTSMSASVVGVWSVAFSLNGAANTAPALTWVPPAVLTPELSNPDNSVPLGERIAVDSLSVQVIAAATVTLYYNTQFLELSREFTAVNQRVLARRVLPAGGVWEEKNMNIQVGGELPVGMAPPIMIGGWNTPVGAGGSRGYGAVWLQIDPAVNGTVTRALGHITFRDIPKPTPDELPVIT